MPTRSRLLSNQLQEWELQDPPSGCSVEQTTPLSGPGQCQVSKLLSPPKVMVLLWSDLLNNLPLL